MFWKGIAHSVLGKTWPFQIGKPPGKFLIILGGYERINWKDQFLEQCCIVGGDLYPIMVRGSREDWFLSRGWIGVPDIKPDWWFKEKTDPYFFGNKPAPHLPF